MLEKANPVSETWTRIRRHAEALVWTDRMVSALDNGVQGGRWHSLHDKVYAEQTLQVAWRHVAQRKGTGGIDGISIDRFMERADSYLKELAERLKEGSFRPQEVKRVYIPKGEGKTRPLGIPTVKDRIVQDALRMVIEPIFEKEFLPTSYGFRPGKGCKDALRAVDELLKGGNHYVVDADLKNYFDTISHEKLLTLIRTRISDSRIQKLIKLYLQQGVLEGMKRWTPTAGTPQGAVLSPLLANLYLHPLDVLIQKSGYRMIRYADDFVILCKSRSEAEAALALVKEWTEAQELILHPEKTHIGDCREEGEGFEFLGYRFEAGKRCVRKKSLRAIKAKIREKTRRTEGRSLEVVVSRLNPMMKGWFEYFKHAEKWTFMMIDGFTRRRLRAMLRKQEKRPGFGLSHGDHKRWPNNFFAQHGLFTLYAAYEQARCPR